MGAPGRIGLAACVLVGAWAAHASASAEWRPAGAVTAHGLIGEKGADNGQRSFGAGGLVDLWEPFGAFRVGATLGLAALSSPDADTSRVFMPAGLSLAVAWRVRHFGIDVRVRGGPWGGALDQGLAAGAWVAGGAYIEYAPSEHVALAAGTDVWFLFGHGSTYVFAPGVGLVWTIDDD